ncbi:MAG: right-handed parallel beta-helix repeat-containing protein [Saprospiraceae bacterium]|nr:right-handed parallel beta-helix repeat-containing protein [Saprospiraceae bacterium]
MKQILFTAFAWLQCLAFNHAQTYQDTTFTDPVVISFAPDFVTFKNCRFIGINGPALTIEGSGVLVADCVFENIQGEAVLCSLSEVYLTNDTITNIIGNGVVGEFGALIVLGCNFTNISGTAILFNTVEVAEANGCRITNAGSGIYCQGSLSVSEALLVDNQLSNIVGQPDESVSGYGIYAKSLLSLRVSGCNLDGCSGVGMIFSGEDDLDQIQMLDVQNNKITKTGGSGIIGYAKIFDALVKSNEVSYPGILGGSGQESEHCIVWNGIDARIESNHLHHALDNACETNNVNCGAGLWITSSALVSKNHIHDCTGDGIHYDASGFPGSEILSIYNNIVHDIAGNALAVKGSLGLYDAGGITIRNNTLHTLGSSPIDLKEFWRPLRLEGNILISEGNSDTTGYLQIAGLIDFTQNLNLKAPGDLGFVNFAGRDFHLADENSPAHKLLPQDFGLPNDDFDGDIRLGLRDAGADEFNSEEAICGCNNCPSTIEDFFTGDFNFSVVSAANNDLSTTSQGVCGVRVEFEHQYLGDLSMELISPAGQKVQLVGPNGFFGSTANTKWNIGFAPCLYPASPDPGFSATWNSNQLWGQSGAYSGIYYPATGCLEDFNEGTVTGDWTLRVFDNQSNDGGAILGFEVMFCDTEGIDCFLCSGPPVAGLSATNVGSWGVTLQNTSTGAPTQFQIDFGDGQSAFTLPIFHEYENPGAYLVRLIASNECGVDTSYQQVQIFGAEPQAFVFVEPEEGCAPLTVQAKVIQEDHVDTWHWIFPGGVPSESFEKEPVVVFPQVGIYTISLEISNEVGTTSIPDVTTLVLTDSLLKPSFLVQVFDNIIQVTNTTQGALNFLWWLNAGAPQGANFSPYQFEVDSSGIYEVTLVASNECGAASTVISVPVIISGTTSLESLGWEVTVAPNPTSGLSQLTIEAPLGEEATLTILNTLGQVISKQPLTIQAGQNNIPVDLSSVAAGAYYLQIQTPRGVSVLKIVKNQH